MNKKKNWFHVPRPKKSNYESMFEYNFEHTISLSLFWKKKWEFLSTNFI